MRRLLSYIFLVASLLFIFTPFSAACTCVWDEPESSCQKVNDLGVVFVGTVIDIENPPNEQERFGTGISRYHFRVDENIHGMKLKEVDVYSGRGGGDCSFHFKKNEQYLVFPYKSDDHRLHAGICSLTQPVKYAGPFLTELRARRDGQKHASLYGVLVKTQAPYSTTTADDFERPLSGITIELRSENHSFSTQTDKNGVYRFYDLPADTYAFKATLPANLVLGRSIIDDPSPKIKVPQNACLERALEALPTSTIKGRVLGSDGVPVKYAAVELFRQEKYTAEAEPWDVWSESQSDKDYFEFRHVTPGTYILAFNNDDNPDPNTPYHRTFYPNSRNLAGAKSIIVAEGQQVVDADIQLTDPIPTRRLQIHVNWNQTSVPDDVYVYADTPTRSCGCVSPKKVSPGLYEVTIFENTRYTIYATQYCGYRWENNTAIPMGSRETERIEVDGADAQTKEVTVTLRDGSCKLPKKVENK